MIMKLDLKPGCLGEKPGLVCSGDVVVCVCVQ